MKKVQAYLTSDGSLFENENDAFAYESCITIRLLIPEFLESSHNTYPKAAQKTIITNSIISWETYLKANGIKV